MIKLRNYMENYKLNDNDQKQVLKKQLIEDDSFHEVRFNINSENRFLGVFPSLNLNSKIRYYIRYNFINEDQISHSNFGWHDFNSLNNSLTAIGNNITTPTTWTLHPNYSNLFNPSTTLSYNIYEDVFVTNSVFDMFGKIIKTLVNNKKNFDFHSIHLITNNNQGKYVEAGIYLYRIEISDLRQLKTLNFYIIEHSFQVSKKVF